MRRVMAIVCVWLTLAGCSNVHHVDPSRDADAADEMNAALRGRFVTVELLNGERREGTGFQVQDSTAVWRQSGESRGLVTMRLSNLTSVRADVSTGTTRRVVGGACMGLVLGLIVGSIVAEQAEKPDYDGAFSELNDDLHRMGIVVNLTALGCLGGAIAGGLRRPQDVYVFGRGSGPAESDTDNEGSIVQE